MSNFPEYALKGCKTALCLFAGAGENDVSYLQKAGVKDCLCVDMDPERLDRIAGYRKETADVFEWIKSAKRKKFDIIISDQNTDMDGQVWEIYDQLKSLSRKYLIISVCWFSMKNGLQLPDGELLKRSDWRNGVYWHITKI